MSVTAKVIAIMPWGNEIEDFLNPLGLDIDDFCERMTEGWLFGTVRALQKQGWRVVVICVSGLVDETARRLHRPTNALVIIVPSGKAYRSLRRRALFPYGTSGEAVFGPRRGIKSLLLGPVRMALPYLATPVYSLKSVLVSESCQAILVQEYEYARFDVVTVLARVMGLEVFATFQGGDVSFSWLERMVRPWTMRLASGLVIGSAREAERVKNVYGVVASKIVSCPNPLDMSVWRRRDRVEMRHTLGLPVSAQIVVCHGRIAIQAKGIDVLLQAWLQVIRERPGRDMRLLLVGDGPDASSLSDLLERTSPNQVIWYRQYILDRPAMNRILCAADIYVMASRQEGFPVAPLEAMACGLPVVASDAPGLAEIITRSQAEVGRLVAREAPEALAAALGELLDQPDLARQLGEAGLTEVTSRYSIEAVGKTLSAALCRGTVH